MRPEGTKVLRRGLRDDQEPRHKTRKVRTQKGRKEAQRLAELRKED